MRLRALTATSRYYIGDEGKYLATKIPALNSERGAVGPQLSVRGQTLSVPWKKSSTAVKGTCRRGGQAACRRGGQVTPVGKARNVKGRFRNVSVTTEHKSRLSERLATSDDDSAMCPSPLRTSHACRKGSQRQRTIPQWVRHHGTQVTPVGKARNVKRRFRNVSVITEHKSRLSERLATSDDSAMCPSPLRTSHACRKGSQRQRTIPQWVRHHGTQVTPVGKARNVKRRFPNVSVTTEDKSRLSERLATSEDDSAMCPSPLRISHACRKGSQRQRTIPQWVRHHGTQVTPVGKARNVKRRFRNVSVITEHKLRLSERLVTSEEDSATCHRHGGQVMAVVNDKNLGGG